MFPEFSWKLHHHVSVAGPFRLPSGPLVRGTSGSRCCRQANPFPLSPDGDLVEAESVLFHATSGLTHVVRAKSAR